MGRAVWLEGDKTTAGATETIALTTTYTSKKVFASMSIEWTAGAAPTNSENLVLTIDRSASTGYGTTVFDETLFDQDAAAYGGGIINFRYDEGPIYLGDDDQIKVTYANTDDLAINCNVTLLPR